MSGPNSLAHNLGLTFFVCAALAATPAAESAPAWVPPEPEPEPSPQAGEVPA